MYKLLGRKYQMKMIGFIWPTFAVAILDDYFQDDQDAQDSVIKVVLKKYTKEEYAEFCCYIVDPKVRQRVFAEAPDKDFVLEWERNP